MLTTHYDPMADSQSSPISSSVNSFNSPNSSKSEITNLSNSIPNSFNISHLFNTPMDRTNFLYWKSQFQDVLEIHNLEDVVHTEIPPQKKLSDGSINPAYSKNKLVHKII
ncbi:hypothetical protein L3X38_009485 [Prunus dulcis]|uniref:Uncharacterized protein n=1 Tax=Prunus dulcis TaxID=3755 RepID=A0AAD4WDR0_PRUDU|nr:hypothetical protein L3X38_009485 [Prunus dulcis]